MRGATVWLVGMMGAGKTAVGAELARRLGRPFVDTDARVEACAGRSIAKLFAEEGEGAFRKREREAVDEVAGSEAIVALGGGAVSQPGMRERLAEAGPVVWLRADLETLLARLGDAGERPLLRGLDAGARRARVAELLAAREPDYRNADLVVETDGRSVEEVASTIQVALGADA